MRRVRVRLDVCYSRANAPIYYVATTARLCATVVKKKPPSNDVVISASSSDVATGPRPWISRRTRPCFDRRGRACDRGRRHSRTRDVHGRLPPARRHRRVPDAWRGEAGVETASPPRTAAVRGAEAEAHPAVSAVPAVPAVPGDARLDWHPGKPRTAPSGRCRTHRRAGTSRARPVGDWRISFSAAHRPAPRRRRTRGLWAWRPPPRGAP